MVSRLSGDAQRAALKIFPLRALKIMSQFGYDLAVAYRIYPKMSASRPPIFAEDKFKLAELCFRSFKGSLGNLKVKLWVLLNHCPPEYEKMFTQSWPAEDLVLVR